MRTALHINYFDHLTANRCGWQAELRIDMDGKKFIDQIAAEIDGDYPLAFKLLGFVVFLTEEGSDELLSGDLISPRTYARWMNVIDRVGWGDLVADARLRKELKDYLWQRYSGLPLKVAREKTVKTVRSFLADSGARSPKALTRQVSAGVKGERSKDKDYVSIGMKTVPDLHAGVMVF